MKGPAFFSHLGTALLLCFFILPGAAQEKSAAPEHPQGEWYLVGRELALETTTVYKTFQVDPVTQLSDLPQLLATLDIQVTDLKTEDYKMLKQGWIDAIGELPAAYSIPADQTISKVPSALQGFHMFKPAKGDTLSPDDIEKLQHAVVLIKSTKAHGSGFFVTPDHVLTNKHVIGEASTVKVSNDFSGQILTGTVIAISEESDIALLKVEDADQLSRTVFQLGDSGQARIGEEITLFGYPLFDNLSLTTTFGRISAKRTSKTFGQVLQLSGAEANPGNSGGPLVNNSGQVIGILTFGYDHLTPSQGFTFCITISQAIPLLQAHCPETFGGQP